MFALASLSAGDCDDPTCHILLQFRLGTGASLYVHENRHETTHNRLAELFGAAPHLDRAAPAAWNWPTRRCPGTWTARATTDCRRTPWTARDRIDCPVLLLSGRTTRPSTIRTSSTTTSCPAHATRTSTCVTSRSPATATSIPFIGRRRRPSTCSGHIIHFLDERSAAPSREGVHADRVKRGESRSSAMTPREDPFSAAYCSSANPATVSAWSTVHTAPRRGGRQPQGEGDEADRRPGEVGGNHDGPHPPRAGGRGARRQQSHARGVHREERAEAEQQPRNRRRGSGPTARRTRGRRARWRRSPPRRGRGKRRSVSCGSAVRASAAGRFVVMTVTLRRVRTEMLEPGAGPECAGPVPDDSPRCRPSRGRSITRQVMTLIHDHPCETGGGT